MVREFNPLSGPWELWACDTVNEVDLTFSAATFTHLGEFDLKFDHIEIPFAEDRPGHTLGRSKLTQIMQGMDQAIEMIMLEASGDNDVARAVFYGEDSDGILEQGEMPQPGHQSHRFCRTLIAACLPDLRYSRVYPKTCMDYNFQRSVAHLAGTLAYPVRRILLPYKTPASGTLGTGDDGTSTDDRWWFYRTVDLTSVYGNL